VNITIIDMLLKTRFFGLHFICRKYPYVFNHFYVMGPKSYQIGEIMQTKRLLRRSRSFKVTYFGTN